VDTWKQMWSDLGAAVKDTITTGAMVIVNAEFGMPEGPIEERWAKDRRWLYWSVQLKI
jgi:hypothetical protein